MTYFPLRAQVSRMLSLLNVPRVTELVLLPASVVLHAFMSFVFLWALHADIDHKAQTDTSVWQYGIVLASGVLFLLVLLAAPFYVVREARRLVHLTVLRLAFCHMCAVTA